jgi:hypothetical protein
MISQSVQRIYSSFMSIKYRVTFFSVYNFSEKKMALTKMVYFEDTKGVIRKQRMTDNTMEIYQ